MFAAFMFVGVALMVCGFVAGYIIGFDQGTWYDPRDARARRVPHPREDRCR